MHIKLHKNAITTPRGRDLIQASAQLNTVHAKQFGVSAETIARWKGRDSVHGWGARDARPAEPAQGGRARDVI